MHISTKPLIYNKINSLGPTNKNKNIAIKIKSIKGYYTLDAWVITNVIQLATERLCLRVLCKDNDPCGRQYDQMTQAARSITANIAEGCSRHQTSRETEMKLLDVARASASELQGDIFFMMFRMGIEPWNLNNENHRLFNSIKLDSPNYSEDWELKAYRNLIAQYDKFKPWVEHESLNVALNAMLMLCNREIVLLQRLIARNLDNFKKNGGFTENLTQVRLEARAEDEISPKCPKCGGKMVKRTIQKGIKQGSQFWGCIKYPQCNGTRDFSTE